MFGMIYADVFFLQLSDSDADLYEARYAMNAIVLGKKRSVTFAEYIARTGCTQS